MEALVDIQIQCSQTKHSDVSISSPWAMLPEEELQWVRCLPSPVVLAYKYKDLKILRIRWFQSDFATYN